MILAQWRARRASKTLIEQIRGEIVAAARRPELYEALAAPANASLMADQFYWDYMAQIAVAVTVAWGDHLVTSAALVTDQKSPPSGVVGTQ